MSQDLRIVRTCRTIRSTFTELLSEKPIDKITISELCTRAEINRKTFYRHYTSLADVASELENEMLDSFSKGFGSGGSISDVGSVIRSVGSVIGNKREFFQKLMRYNPELFTNGRLKEALCRMIVAVMKNRNSKSDEQTLKMAADFAVSGVFALYAEWFENGDIDWEKINTLSITLAENALSTV